MLNSAALTSVMRVALMMLMILGTGVEAAPTERGKKTDEITGNGNSYLDTKIL